MTSLTTVIFHGQKGILKYHRRNLSAKFTSHYGFGFKRRPQNLDLEKGDVMDRIFLHERKDKLDLIEYYTSGLQLTMKNIDLHYIPPSWIIFVNFAFHRVDNAALQHLMKIWNREEQCKLWCRWHPRMFPYDDQNEGETHWSLLKQFSTFIQNSSNGHLVYIFDTKVMLNSTSCYENSKIFMKGHYDRNLL